MRDATTHDELSRRLRMAQQSDPVRDAGPPKGNAGEDPSKQHAQRDLIADSTVLCYGGSLTLVPKGAVLHLPEKLQDRVGVKPNVQVKTWRDFYGANRGWIRAIEVTRDQAIGHAPLPEATLATIEDSSSLVIATYKNGPISVLPLKDPEDVPKRSERKPVTYR